MNVMDWDYQWASFMGCPRYAGAQWEDCPSSSEGDGRLVTIPDMFLPPGWDRTHATVAFWVPRYFPCARPRGFWTVERVYLEGDRLPQWTGMGYYTRPLPPQFAWAWFHEPREWSPNGDTLLTYAHFVRMRFQTLR